MPPFGDEPKEKTAKPLSFLSFRHESKPGGLTSFGPEGAEAQAPGLSTQKSTVKRPFADESESEHEHQPGPSRVTHQKKNLGAFCEEGSEDDSEKPLKRRTLKPFEDEGHESDPASSSGDTDDERSFVAKTATVFSFGWNTVATFKKATFWRENMDDEKAKPPKRTYDNSKRSAQASYVRQNSKGAYKRNGVDPARLQKLFDASSCSCAFISIKY